MAIGLKIKHSTGEITTGTGNLTLNAAGDLVLDYATFPSADGTSGQILKTDGAGNLSWAADSGGPADTDALPEGSSNLYYTDARVDARITNAGSANWNTAYGWGDHASGGYLTSTGALSSHTDVHNAAPTDGQVLKWVNANSRWEPATSGTGTVTSITAGTGLTGGTITTTGTIAVDVGTTASKIVQLDGSAKLPAVDGSQLTNLPSGSSTLTGLTDVDTAVYQYASTQATGVAGGPYKGLPVAWNPTDSEWQPSAGIAWWDDGTMVGTTPGGTSTTFSHLTLNAADLKLANYRVHSYVSGGNANRTLIFGGHQKDIRWSGDSGGQVALKIYFDSNTATNNAITFHEAYTFPKTAGTNGQILKTDASGNITWQNDSGGIALTDLSVATASAGTAALAYNNGTGVFTFTPPDLSSYLTSIAADSIKDTMIDWGTGANQVSTADIPEQTNLYYTDARADARITNAGSANWNTAYGWGNHASGGYLTSVGALTSHTDVTISGPSTGQHLTYNGSAWVNSTVSAASAAGSDTYVQFNDGGNMGADAGLTYAKATDTLTAGTFTTSGASPTLTAATALAITTTAGNGNIDLDPHGSGQVVFKGNATRGAGQFKLNCEANTHGITIKGPPHSAAANYTLTLPTTDGNAGEILSTDGAGNLSWIADDDTPAGYNNANWDTAYGWGDHASGGYLTSTGVLSSHTDVHNSTPNGSDVLTWSASQNRWEPAAPQFTGFFGLSDTAIDTAADSIAFLDSDNSTKRDTIADFLTAIAGTNLTAASGQLNASGGGGSQNVFSTIAVSGQSDVVADATTDTLTLAAGSNMTITTNAGSDTITFASSGGGGGSSSETFTVNYAAGGTSISSISGLPAGWSSSINGNNVTITHTAGGQPMGVSFYGLDKSASPDVWKYGYPTSTYPLTFPDTGAGEVISTTEFTLNIGTSATGANTGTPFATSLAHIKVIF